MLSPKGIGNIAYHAPLFARLTECVFVHFFEMCVFSSWQSESKLSFAHLTYENVLLKT